MNVQRTVNGFIKAGFSGILLEDQACPLLPISHSRMPRLPSRHRCREDRDLKMKCAMCARACMHACVRACVRACVCVRKLARARARVFACVRVCVLECACVFVRARVRPRVFLSIFMSVPAA